MANLEQHQVNTSVLGMASAVFTSLCSMLVVAAVQGRVLVERSFSVAIHGVTAAEHIAKAAESRAEIYGGAITKNGAIAEQEQTLKHQLRVEALERQVNAAKGKSQADTPKPASKVSKATTKK